VKLKCVVLPAVAAGLFGISGVASANLVVNGGFETGSFSSWGTSGLTCSGVGANFSAASGGCVGYDGDPGPHGGTKAAYLGTAAGGGVISQSIATTAGETYLVDFFLAIGSAGGSATPNSLSFNFGSATLLSLTNASAQAFAHYSYLYTATAGSAALTITHGNAPSFFILDDVAVNKVPEPATLLLMGLSIAGLGLARRRKARI